MTEITTDAPAAEQHKCHICLGTDADAAADADAVDMGPWREEVLEHVGRVRVHGTCFEQWTVAKTARGHIDTGAHLFGTGFINPDDIIADPASTLPYGPGLLLDVCPNRECPYQLIEKYTGCDNIKCLCGAEFMTAASECHSPQRTLVLLAVGLGWDQDKVALTKMNCREDFTYIALRNGHIDTLRRLLRLDYGIKSTSDKGDVASTIIDHGAPDYQCLREHLAVDPTVALLSAFRRVMCNLIDSVSIDSITTLLNDTRLASIIDDMQVTIWRCIAGHDRPPVSLARIFKAHQWKQIVTAKDVFIKNSYNTNYEWIALNFDIMPFTLADFLNTFLFDLRPDHDSSSTYVKYHAAALARLAQRPDFFAALITVPTYGPPRQHIGAAWHIPLLFLKAPRYLKLALAADDPTVGITILMKFAPRTIVSLYASDPALWFRCFNWVLHNYEDALPDMCSRIPAAFFTTSDAALWEPILATPTPKVLSTPLLHHAARARLYKMATRNNNQRARDCLKPSPASSYKRPRGCPDAPSEDD